MKTSIPYILIGVITVLMISVLGMIFGDTLVFSFAAYVPTEATMGIVQRIFYFHVRSGASGGPGIRA